MKEYKRNEITAKMRDKGLTYHFFVKKLGITKHRFFQIIHGRVKNCETELKDINKILK